MPSSRFRRGSEGWLVVLAAAACTEPADRPLESMTGVTATDEGADDDGESTNGDEGPGDTTAGDDGGPGCASDDDCIVPGLGACDANDGTCVGCVSDDDCPGLACNGDHLCDGCDGDSDCPLGTTCQQGVCAPGCTAEQPCPGAWACCGTCVDLATDASHCGECDNECAVPSHADGTCFDHACGLGECEPGYADCNADPEDGCELEGECDCEPGTMQECYSDRPETMGVGACANGMQACNEFGTSWGPCEGEVTPDEEVCANAVDDDCDGTVDEDPDADGDGFTACGGDCCDEQGPECANPELVNPGAFEVDGNTVDDDCDGTADNPLPACDAGLATNTNSALDYARAIDLCQFTDEVPADPADAVWGVIEGEFALASGAGVPSSNSRSVRDGFGNTITNRFGDRMVVLSTGRAADNAGDTNPGWLPFQTGQSMNTQSSLPADWLGFNGGAVPNAPDCPGPIDSTAYNPMSLRLLIRVPTNANSFSVDMFFFSAEYPEYVCTEYNDFFVTLVDSTDPSNPADMNIAIYDDGVDTWPLGVNILAAANGLFTACTDGTISQCGTPVAYTGCTSNAELDGTGFDIDGETQFGCDYGGEAGGGTGWLAMSGNVTPGEVMELRFIIWDSSDQLFDSLVLLDNWQWSVQASEPGVEPG
jgi:hypothetical protein